jgi:hypothetical protein
VKEEFSHDGAFNVTLLCVEFVVEFADVPFVVWAITNVRHKNRNNKHLKLIMFLGC